jgi:hypothetical protein
MTATFPSQTRTTTSVSSSRLSSATWIDSSAASPANSGVAQGSVTAHTGVDDASHVVLVSTETEEASNEDGGASCSRAKSSLAAAADGETGLAETRIQNSFLKVS